VLQQALDKLHQKFDVHRSGRTYANEGKHVSYTMSDGGRATANSTLNTEIFYGSADPAQDLVGRLGVLVLRRVLVDFAQDKVQAHRLDDAVDALERDNPQLDISDLINKD
jgi:hypothetical protein